MCRATLCFHEAPVEQPGELVVETNDLVEAHPEQFGLAGIALMTWSHDALRWSRTEQITLSQAAVKERIGFASFSHSELPNLAT